MDDREALTHLRSVVYQGDGPGLVTVLSKVSWPTDSLQLIGDGLLAAVSADIDGAADLARTCVSMLGERNWEGDRELAEALAAALGDGPVPMLRPLPVNLEELAMILEGDPRARRRTDRPPHRSGVAPARNRVRRGGRRG